jgi:uncharacterized protein (TIGR01440 family)
MDINILKSKIREVINELLNVSNLEEGDIVILGGSSSEILGKPIGSATNLEVGKTILEGVLPVIKNNNLFLAVQGCEHINRSLVVEKACYKKYNLEIVNVIPYIEAGGSLATAAMEMFDEAVVVEGVKAKAGIDIGDTFIGMHLKEVAVPVRLNIKKIGEAHLSVARSRPKMVGGERARYQKL